MEKAVIDEKEAIQLMKLEKEFVRQKKTVDKIENKEGFAITHDEALEVLNLVRLEREMKKHEKDFAKLRESEETSIAAAKVRQTEKLEILSIEENRGSIEDQLTIQKERKNAEKAKAAKESEGKEQERDMASMFRRGGGMGLTR